MSKNHPLKQYLSSNNEKTDTSEVDESPVLQQKTTENESSTSLLFKSEKRVKLQSSVIYYQIVTVKSTSYKCLQFTT